MKKEKTTEKIVKALKKTYPARFPEGTRDPYKVLVATLLSHRTKDEITYPAAKRLFKKAGTPKKMLKLSTEKIEKLIYPVGFYRTKAKRIKTISRLLLERHKGIVPDTLHELTKIKGVGRKTANIVLAHAFGKKAIAVDAHVHRISNRLGLVRTKTPEQTEFALMRVLPKKYWTEFNQLLVRHGQKICRPVSPLCTKCPIQKYCKKRGVKWSR